MVDPRKHRLEIWRSAIAAAERQLYSFEISLVHPGNTPYDTLIAGFWREIAACHVDSLKTTYKKISGE
jgi:hypothetical protein